MRPTLEFAYLGSDSVMVYQEQKEDKFCWRIQWQSENPSKMEGLEVSLFLNGGIAISGLWV